MTLPNTVGRVRHAALAAISLILLSGCAATGLSTAVGPSRKAVVRSAETQSIPGLVIVPVTGAVLQSAALPATPTFADAIGDARPIGTVVGIGDIVEVSIWEAPPALLFGGSMLSTRIGTESATSRPGVLPETMVGPSGTITVPFAGQVPAAGRSLREIEQSIVSRLRGKANQPQAIVRITRNATANVSVVGEVANAGRVPLTPKGERLLDVVAASGGTRQPPERMTVQLTRGDRTVTMPLIDVVRDPRQNIILEKDDVITALYQPFSLTVLGAAGKNEEIRFEGTGLTLSQALGRIGGLQDMRADPRGVFVFRWEPAAQVQALGRSVPAGATQVPVVYQVDLREPATYFVAQKFAMRDDDIIFIANSPATDFQRFVNILASSVLPTVSVANQVRAQ